jgi:hypothetical protein
MIEVIFYLLILATAFPIGLLLARLCEDELVKDKKYFFMMSCLLILISIIFLLYSMNFSMIFSSIYMIFIFSILLYKGKASR